MTPPKLIAASALTLAAFVFSLPAHGQDDVVDRFEGLVEWLGRGLDLVGEKSEDFIGPGLEPLNEIKTPDFSGLATFTVPFAENYPVRPNAAVAVRNKFGEIRVNTWNNPIVQVQADIQVGAEDPALAREIAQDIDIHVDETLENVSVRTVLPDTRGRGRLRIVVDYVLTIPETASLSCENHWADTIVRGVSGAVTIKSRFGVVDLSKIAGPVRVWAEGEFPVQVSNLSKGGSFSLRDARAEFRNVAGVVDISNYMGAVTVQDMPPETEMSIRNVRAPVHLYLPDSATPDIDVSVFFGDIKSDVPLDRTSRGDLIIARSANVESKQRISVRTFFGDVTIHAQGIEATSPGSLGTLADDSEPVEDPVLTSIPLAPDSELVLDAIRGGVRVEGVDDEQVTVTATRHVRLTSIELAQEVLDTLQLRTEKIDGRVVVRTLVDDDLAELGCTYYRIDLVVQCPRSTRLKVHAENGRTLVSGMDGPVTVVQNEGGIAVERTTGEVDVTAHKGDIEIADCAGPVQALAKAGRVTTRNVSGKQAISCSQGTAAVNAPGGDVTVRSRGGNVSIIAEDGVFGDYDISVIQGDISLVLPESADARLVVSAKRGEIYSTLPTTLTGGIYMDQRDFTCRLSPEGRFTLKLETESGDIALTPFASPEESRP